MANPVRVAQIMGYMNGGGVESVVMNYYRNIDRERLQFDFVVCRGSTMVPRREIEALGGRVFMIPPYSQVIGYQKELIALFREQGWKITHSHNNALSVFPLRAAKKAGVPVRIAHSHSTSGSSERAKNALKAVLRTQANRYPTHRLACSSLAGDWLYGKDADYKVLRNAIDLNAFRPDEADRFQTRAALGVEGGQLLIGHIGRFMEQKNHALLIEIFREVLRLRPDSVLALVGEGPLLDVARRKARELGIDGSIRFLGTRSDTPSLYRAFDVFCLPSFYEGLPMVGVECQASGTPILASDAVTNEAAMTSLMDFEPLGSSPKAWALHLINMRGRVFAPADAEGLSAFDINVAAKQLEELYETCLKEVGA